MKLRTFLLSIIYTLNTFCVANATTTTNANSALSFPSAGPSPASTRFLQEISEFELLNTSQEKRGNSDSKSRNSNFLVHQGQILVLIFIITGVDIIKQKYELANLKQEQMNTDDLLSLGGEAAEHIISSPEIWSSLIGGGTAGVLFAKPLAIINKIIENSSSRVIFKRLLQSGIASFITFLGWELGSQLWQQATQMLSNEQDYKMAQDLGLMLSSTLSSDILQKEDAIRIMQEILSNISTIFENDRLRDLWLYNTWRLKIATGNFITLVTSMVSATAIGTTLFPGAGTLAGLMFGVVGGTLALFIPEDVKDSITNGAQEVRLRLNVQGKLHTNLMEIRNYIHYYENDYYVLYAKSEYDLKRKNSSTNMLTNRIRHQLTKRTPVREHALNVYFERIYRAHTRINRFLGQIQIASNYRNTKSLRELEDEIIDNTHIFEKAVSGLDDFYQKERDKVLSVLNSTQIENTEYTKVVSNFKNLIDNLEWGIKRLLTALKSRDKIKKEEAIVAINTLYLEGFTEDKLMKAVDQERLRQSDAKKVQ